MVRWMTVFCGLLVASAASAQTPAGTETVEQALCRLIESSAQARRIPVDFFTRLIWRESSFRASAVSSAGAQGIAQFMPGTARERGLQDPFDPEQAIPASAAFISELTERFGNVGLAAAAYNGGPGRVSSWLAGRGELPTETRDYVVAITGRSAEDWSEAGRDGKAPEAKEDSPDSCLKMVALLRRPGGSALAAGPLAPWGVQLAGNFSKALALAAFARTRQSYASILGDTRPMVIGTRLRSRGTRAFYRVRVPSPSRTEADRLCTRIRTVGGSCIVLPS